MLTGRKDSWLGLLAWSSASLKTFSGFFFFFFFAVKMISKLLKVEDKVLHFQGPSVSRVSLFPWTPHCTSEGHALQPLTLIDVSRTVSLPSFF